MKLSTLLMAACFGIAAGAALILLALYVSWSGGASTLGTPAPPLRPTTHFPGHPSPTPSPTRTSQ